MQARKSSNVAVRGRQGKRGGDGTGLSLGAKERVRFSLADTLDAGGGGECLATGGGLFSLPSRVPHSDSMRSVIFTTLSLSLPTAMGGGNWKRSGFEIRSVLGGGGGRN